MIPAWPQRAASAIVHLFRPLQDIDVYVEDKGDEQFYSELFRQIATSRVRVQRVFAAGGRTAVLTTAEKHDFALRKALFLIDGDLGWLRGEPPPQIKGVFRLEAYCIENLLLSEAAAVQVLVEQEAISEQDAVIRLQFSAWQSGIEGPLLHLFLAFAVLNYLNPKHATVSLGVGNLLGKSEKGKQPVLDLKKTQALSAEIMQKSEEVAGKERSESLYKSFERRAKGLPRPFDAISGKDFLLPLFEYRLWSCTKDKCRRKSLRFRLARHCERTLFKELSLALERSLVSP